MTKNEKMHVLNMGAIAYYSGWNGIEIKNIEHGFDDFVLYVQNAWYGKKSAHRAKINYTASGNAYFNANGRRIPLNECICCHSF